MYSAGYNDDQGRNYQHWEQQKQPLAETNRLWVEISDDEENMCLDRPLFHDASGKPHHTPPLDLSALDKPGRHVESPLDLSVKTRKRCADSTEFEDQHFAHMQQHKRMCMPGEHKGYSDYNSKTGMLRYGEESVIKHKVISATPGKPIAQKMPYSANVPSPLAQTSPLAYAQQQSFSNVRTQQHQPSRMKQMSQAQMTKLPSKLPQSIPQQLSHMPQYQQQVVPPQTVVKQQNYEQYPLQPKVPGRIVPSKAMLTSETTALQGFYEPSLKHTLTVRGNVPSNDLGRSMGRDRSLESRIADTRIASEVYGRSSVAEQVLAERAGIDVQTVQRTPPSIVAGIPYPPGTRSQLSANSRRSYDQAQIDTIQQQQQQQQNQLRQQMIIRESSDLNRVNRIVDSTRIPAYGPSIIPHTETLLNDHERERMALVMKQYHSSSRPHMLPYQVSPPQPQPQPQPQQAPLPQRPQLVFHPDVHKSLPSQRRSYDAGRDIIQSQAHRVDVPRRDIPMPPASVSDIQTQLELHARHGIGIRPSDIDLQRNYHHSSSNTESIQRSYNSSYMSASQGMSLYSKEAKNSVSRVGNRLQRSEVVHVPVDYPMTGPVNPQTNRTRDSKSVSSVSHGGQPIVETEQVMQHALYAAMEPKSQRADKPAITIENLLSEQTSCNPNKRKSTFDYLLANPIRSSHMKHNSGTAQKDSPVVASQVRSNVDHKQPQSRAVQSNYPHPRQPHTDQTACRQLVSQRSPRRRPSGAVSRPTSTASIVSSRETTEHVSSESKTLMTNIMFPAMSGSARIDRGRSIMAGTSGLKTDKLDAFDAFVLDELRKDTDDSDNLFKNKSVLQAFDRSANPSPCLVSETEPGDNDTKHVNPPRNVEKSKLVDGSAGDAEASYVLPIHIAIPGSKSAQRDSVITSAMHDQGSSGNPKVWSRKHMILNAYKQDKDLNTVVNIDENEKIPVASSNFLAPKRTEKDTIIANPPSPKMPILSPEEQKRHTPLVSPAPRDPPTLESTTSSNKPVVKSAKEINTLEEQLHKIISDAVKCQGSFDKESVCESVYRELASQPQGHKPFLSRQTSQSKHIPVANVAPMVHARSVNDNKAPLDGEVKSETMGGNNDTGEDKQELLELQAKDSANEVTLVDDNVSPMDEHIGGENDAIAEVRRTFDVYKAIDVAMAEHDSKSSEHSMSYQSEFLTTNAAENGEEDDYFTSSNAQKQFIDSEFRIGDGNNNDKPGISREYNYTPVPVSTRRCSRTEHKDTENDRNVFGAFNELLAQRRASLEQRDAALTEIDEANRQAQYAKDGYEGDDEDRAEKQTTKKKQSNVRQKADKLIRKAKQKKSHTSDSSETLQAGSIRRLSHSSQGQCFPGQRSRSNSKNLQLSPTSRRLSHADEDVIPDESKADNEVFKNDESTDEEYFQNYEDEFKQFLKKQGSDTTTTLKKTPAPRKKKGLQFQLKYFSQRKRKTKPKKPRAPVGSSIGVALAPSCSTRLDQLYDFEDEDFTIQRPAPKSLPVRLPLNLAYPHEMPIPPDLKRLAVNKDTGETLLHKAARMGYEEVVLYCLTVANVDINVRDNAGYTPLHECAVTGRVSIARHLLGHGADVNVCSIDGIRPIHDAVEHDQLETLRLLLSFGADPTLSTYAGKALVKIARTDRMRKFLTRYVADLNGCKSDSEALVPWQYRASSTVIEPEVGLGCAIFTGLPSDPEDETTDMCTLSAKPLFPTQRITGDGGKRVEDYILLDDILKGYKVTRSEVEGHIPSLMLKTIAKDTFLDSNKNSVYIEKYNTRASSLVEGLGFSAIRQVDSAQVISKIEKRACATKRSKL